MCSLFLVVAMRDPSKHSIVLRRKAKLIFVVIHVVTCDFTTSRLIDNNNASLNQIPCIHLPYRHRY